MYCQFETPVPSLTDFMNHSMTEIGGANYVGFCSGGHILSSNFNGRLAVC